MNKKNADEKILKLCAKFVNEAEKLSGVEATEKVKKPCGLIIFIFGEDKNAIFASGKVAPLAIAEFLATIRGGIKGEPTAPTSSTRKLKPYKNN